MKTWINKIVQSIPKKLRWPLLVISVILFISITGYTLILYGGKLLVDEEKMILPATTTLETADGEIIHQLYEKNRIPVTIDQIPEHVKKAFVSVEDRRFYEHAGVDFKSVLRAIIKDIIARSKVEGASTITQQVAKNIFFSNDKTWMRKTKEVMVAIYLERHYSKDKILELYLNAVYFGHGVYGIEAASQKFFTKSVEELSLTEGALLAGLVKAPNGYSPIKHPEKAKERRNTVLKTMDVSGVLTTEERVQEQGKTLGLDVKEHSQRPWNATYIDLVTKEAARNHQLTMDELKRGGYRMVINLDEKAQQIAYEQFQKDYYFPGNVKDVEGAFVMTKHGEGKVVAAIGGRNFQFGHLNRVTVNRQPGSTMKPIAVYGPAMMKEYQPFTILPDQKGIVGKNTPVNSNGEYAGYVSLYTALMQSKNTSAVWTLDQIGVDYAKQFLKKMEIELPHDKNLSIALGGLHDGINPLQLVNAYATFANYGIYTPAETIQTIYNRNNELIYEKEISETEVFTPQVSWNMIEMLSETVNQGTAKAGTYQKALAGKTGTAEHPHVSGKNKDIWFAGFTPEYTLTTWIGYDQSDKNHYLTGGSSYPTELTKQILTKLDKQKGLTETFTKPEEVASVPKPIILPTITDVKASVEWGGITLLQGRISWEGTDDKRIEYRIYRVTPDIDERVGEVKGKNEFIIRDFSLLQTHEYYIVPYDPLTKMEGKRSEIVEISR